MSTLSEFSVSLVFRFRTNSFPSLLAQTTLHGPVLSLAIVSRTKDVLLDRMNALAQTLCLGRQWTLVSYFFVACLA